MSTTPDEYAGQGGSYLLDPKTGRRTLIERTEPALPITQIEELSDATPEPQATDSAEVGDDLRD